MLYFLITKANHMKQLQTAPFKIGQKLECIKHGRHWQNGNGQDTYKEGLIIMITSKQMISSPAGKVTIGDESFIDEGEHGYNTSIVLPDGYSTGYIIDVENMHWFKEV